MSNAMRLGKRTLAGVAAGALALGVLSVAGATSASAKPNVKPKATKAATVNAVRATGLGTTAAINTPLATLTWSGAPTISAVSSIDLLSAPSATAKLYYNADDTVQLNADDSAGAAVTTNTNYSTDDSMFSFRVDTAGSYTGTIHNGVDTVTFSFSTSGAPASMTLAPATQTVLVGAQADLALTLLDANGRATQPQTVDSVALTRAPTDDTLVRIDDTVASYNVITGLSATNMATGTGYFSLNTNPAAAGTTTVTATPLGTLPPAVTTQTASVTKTGTVASTSVKGIAVAVPTSAAQAGLGTTAATAQVPEGTTTIGLLIDDTTTATAGNKIRLAMYLTAGGTINGSAATSAAPIYADLTTDANKQVTTSLAIGGAGALNNSQLVVRQVNVNDTQVTPNRQMTVTWVTPAVMGSNIVPTPEGSAIAKVGASTPVSVQVDDSFGLAQSGWTVRAYRTSVGAANLVSSGVTNASGAASLTVSPLATTVNGQSETYKFTAQPPVGTEINGTNDLVITYSTSGNITSMSVTTGSSTSPCSNTSCTLTTYPAILVPSSGIVSGSQSGGVFTVASATVTTAPTTNMMTFKPDTNPGNPVTVTVPEGVKVTATAPTATTLWSGGAQTATVADNNDVYVWATKTGTHDIKFESGGLSVTMKLRVINTGRDAYTMALTPASQNLATGSFGTITLSVNDAFGNPVQTNDDSGAVTLGATGEVRFGGGFNTIAGQTTTATGTALISLIAGSAGAGAITAGPTTGQRAPAWVTGYVKPAGFPDPVTSAAATVSVGTGPVTRSITITGSRTTVSGKPGIKIDGVVSGIEDGKTVIPYFRFPGETTFAQGSARPEITDGAFTWQRKTGKKFYAYVTNDDGAVTSNRVIIPAN